MVLKHSFRLALFVVCILSFAAAQAPPRGGVSGRLVIRTPDGKEIPGDKVSAYLMSRGEGPGRVEIKDNCVDHKCTKQAFVDGKEIDITGLQTDREIYEATEPPVVFYDAECLRQLVDRPTLKEKAGNATPTREQNKLARCVVYGSKGSELADHGALEWRERAVVATAKWAADHKKTDQFFTVGTSEDGKFSFEVVPEGNYYFVAFGSVGERHAFWDADVTVKSGKTTVLDSPRVDHVCPPL